MNVENIEFELEYPPGERNGWRPFETREMFNPANRARWTQKKRAIETLLGAHNREVIVVSADGTISHFRHRQEKP